MVASFFGEGVLLADAMSSPRVFGPMLGRWAGERCLYLVWAVQLSLIIQGDRSLCESASEPVSLNHIYVTA